MAWRGDARLGVDWLGGASHGRRGNEKGHTSVRPFSFQLQPY